MALESSNPACPQTCLLASNNLGDRAQVTIDPQHRTTTSLTKALERKNLTIR